MKKLEMDLMFMPPGKLDKELFEILKALDDATHKIPTIGNEVKG